MQKKQSVPTTGRSARYQVQQMGFSDVEAFAQSLPKNARILDIGAGLSKLGHEAVKVRSDVEWVNIDTIYTKKVIKTSNKSPHFLCADITDADVALLELKGSADLVYSYWLLPHLSLETSEPALRALKNMKMFLKNSGVLCVGPTRHVGFGLLSPFRYRGTVKHKRTELTTAMMEQIVQDTKLWWLPRVIQRFSNKYNVHLLKAFVGGR